MFKIKLEEEIIRLWELCLHMDTIVGKLRRRPLFDAALRVSAIKKDEPLLIRTLMAL